jgi:hypothetical protein
VAVLSLLKLAALTERADFRARRRRALNLFADTAYRTSRRPSPFMLVGFDFALEEPKPRGHRG